jgi:hypothetical protein
MEVMNLASELDGNVEHAIKRISLRESNRIQKTIKSFKNLQQ